MTRQRAHLHENAKTYTSSHSDGSHDGFETRDRLRTLAIVELPGSANQDPNQRLTTYMQLLGTLAQGRIVLLDKVPAHLVLGKVTISSR